MRGAPLIFTAAGALVAATIIGVASSSAQSGDPASQQAELKAATKAVKSAETRARQLHRAASTEQDEARRARTREPAIAASIQAAEAEIIAARARIALVDQQLVKQRTSLTQQQQPITRLIAALQSLARRPPVLALVQPGSTRDIVHVRAVLGAITPQMQSRTAEIRKEITRTRQLRDNAQLAVKSLADGRKRLQDERLALVRMEAEHRLKSVGYRREALFESDRALALGEQARDLVDLMDSMGEAAETRAALEALPGPLPRPTGEGEKPAEASIPQRFGPPPYRLPVNGTVVTGLGELSDTGVRARGLTIATWPGTQVIAPTGGRVLFAGKFRRYGNIVILDHGAGWTSLIAGLDRISVRVGDTLVQGSPLGRSAQSNGQVQSPQITVELRRQGRPVDLAQLLD